MIRLIIYDDSPERREGLKALMSLTEDMECVADFPDCSHVIEDMEMYYPDVVLMDIEMPKADGISGVSQIKQHFPEIRIIMQTVFEDEEKIFASLKAGAEGYILKTATADRIVQSIREVFDGGAYMTPSVALRVLQYSFGPVKSDEALQLTPKETDVLRLLAEGLSYKMIADKLAVSYFTVNAHIRKIYSKLHVHSIGEAVALAYKNRML